MSRICQFCGKGYKKGNSVTRLIGNRVSNRSIKKQQPNLKTRKIVIDGTSMKAKLCTKCLSRIKKETSYTKGKLVI
jgi:ribosomal protein L28